MRVCVFVATLRMPSVSPLPSVGLYSGKCGDGSYAKNVFDAHRPRVEGQSAGTIAADTAQHRLDCHVLYT